MAEYVAPVHRGLPVPWIAMWSAERVGPVMGIDPSTGDWVPVERTSYARRERGMWMMNAPTHREGTPDFGSTHSARQRRAMERLLCQICGERRRDQMVWVIPRDGGTHEMLWAQRLVLNAPVCRPCLDFSTTVCPHLRTTEPVAVVPARIPVPVWITGDYWDGNRVRTGCVAPLGTPETRHMVGHELIVRVL